jgi:hypothetical protein
MANKKEMVSYDYSTKSSTKKLKNPRLAWALADYSAGVRLQPSNHFTNDLIAINEFCDIVKI